jgi:hypothetical protein
MYIWLILVVLVLLALAGSLSGMLLAPALVFIGAVVLLTTIILNRRQKNRPH